MSSPRSGSRTRTRSETPGRRVTGVHGTVSVSKNSISAFPTSASSSDLDSDIVGGPVPPSPSGSVTARPNDRSDSRDRGRRIALATEESPGRTDDWPGSRSAAAGQRSASGFSGMRSVVPDQGSRYWCSSNREEIGGLGLVSAWTIRATAADCLLPFTCQAIRKHLRDCGVGAGVAPEFMAERNSELLGTRDGTPPTPSQPPPTVCPDESRAFRAKEGRRRHGWRTRGDRRAGLGGAVGAAGLRLKRLPWRGVCSGREGQPERDCRCGGGKVAVKIRAAWASCQGDELMSSGNSPYSRVSARSPSWLVIWCRSRPSFTNPQRSSTACDA